jgi:DNA (cytosine-5)-methyltransferase 1
MTDVVADRLDLQLGIERFARRRSTLTRRLSRRDGTVSESTIRIPDSVNEEELRLDRLFDLAWLRSTSQPSATRTSGVVRVVDLFAGCGGLSVGITEACRALELEAYSVLANDFDSETLEVYGLNFPEARLAHGPIESLLDSDCGEPLSTSERRIRRELGEIDLVIGGPPCQGHSDFNNHTRNADPKNALYLKMARFCEVVRPAHVIIENVPGVERDKGRSAQRTWAILRDLGYEVDSGVIDASALGAAQRRKRSITLASRVISPSISALVSDLAVDQRNVMWAIGDLEYLESEQLFDNAPQPSAENSRRMQFLLEHGLYELPDSERPDCHRLKEHTYQAVYGRLRSWEPSPTITTGFGSTGRGRFVHPTLPRTLTPHEAARIQFFPDFYNFGRPTRTKLHRMIGNAVPAKLGYALGIHLLR